MVKTAAVTIEIPNTIKEVLTSPVMSTSHPEIH